MGKLFAGLTYTLLLILTVIPDVYKSLFQINSHLPSTVLFSGFPMGKAVPGISHWSEWHSKHNSLKDWANFRRARGEQIFNIRLQLRLLYFKFDVHRSSKFVWILIVIATLCAWNICTPFHKYFITHGWNRHLIYLITFPWNNWLLIPCQDRNMFGKMNRVWSTIS